MGKSEDKLRSENTDLREKLLLAELSCKQMKSKKSKKYGAELPDVEVYRYKLRRLKFMFRQFSEEWSRGVKDLDGLVDRLERIKRGWK